MQISALLLAVLLVACGRSGEDKPAPRDPSFRASHTGSLDPKLPDGSELTISAAVDITDGLRAAVETALAPVMIRARSCKDTIAGTVFAEIELDAKGVVTRATVRSSPLLEGTPIAKCIETELAKMNIGPVQGAPIRINVPVTNNPLPEQPATDLVKRAQ
jgi:hypothetical protein